MILSQEEYNSLFPSIPIPTDEYQELEESAEEDINYICYGKIERIGFDNLTESQKNKVKRAIGYQIQYQYFNGGLLAMTETGEIQSATVSKFSYSLAQETVSEAVKINGRTIHSKVKMILLYTNLLNPSVCGV